ncbi:hypothetical protein MRX96_032820 [Rhipicephalus microplus]
MLIVRGRPRRCETSSTTSVECKLQRWQRFPDNRVRRDTNRPSFVIAAEPKVERASHRGNSGETRKKGCRQKTAAERRGRSPVRGRADVRHALET